jgi:hypothetical protein
VGTDRPLFGARRTTGSNTDKLFRPTRNIPKQSSRHDLGDKKKGLPPRQKAVLFQKKRALAGPLEGGSAQPPSIIEERNGGCAMSTLNGTTPNPVPNQAPRAIQKEGRQRGNLLAALTHVFTSRFVRTAVSMKFAKGGVVPVLHYSYDLCGTRRIVPTCGEVSLALAIIAGAFSYEECRPKTSCKATKFGHTSR